MNQLEYKHSVFCNTCIIQIKGIQAAIEDMAEKRDFIFTGGGYDSALDGLNMAVKALREITDGFFGEDEEDEEYFNLKDFGDK